MLLGTSVLLLTGTGIISAACALAASGQHQHNPRQAQSSKSSNTESSQNLAFSPPFYPSPWVDGSGDWAAALQKAQAFVQQLTLIEKVNLTTGVGWEGEACVGNTGAIPRLGFRPLCLQDSPLGVRDADYVSAFPGGGTVAASWDRQVWYDRGYAMGSEHNAKGVDVQLGPVVGPLGRFAEGGRNWEGFSPDPVLSGVAVSHTVKGIQAAGVVACTKHYIANEQEHFRQSAEAQGYGYNIKESISANLDDITLHELYLWPFADAVRAGTGSIMCSYNQINNSYGCQNSHLINGILKGELGFQGFVMSDWQAQHAGVATSLAGLDMSMPGDTVFSTGRSYWGTNLTIAVLNGTIPEWRIDDMAVRIMSAFYYVGRDSRQVPINFNSWTRDTFGYQHPQPKLGYGQVNYHVDVRAEHGQLIRDHAAKSTVLLKNTNGALPLTGQEKLVGVFGEDATDNVLGPNGCSDRGCDDGTLAMGWGSGTANFPYLISPLNALQNEVIYRNNGLIDWVTDNNATSKITALASLASVAIVFVNADSGEGYISVNGNEGDRENLDIWNNGSALIRNVASACNNTIVVIHSVGPVLVDTWSNNTNVTAIIWAGLPGEQSGNAIADILYGRVNPSGKLAFTIAEKREDYGTNLLYKPNNGNAAPQDTFTEGIFLDYRHFDRANITPVYEFGYGLSYTTFEYTNLQVQTQSYPAYTPNEGFTAPAPSLGNFSTDPADYQFPANFSIIPLYIYPYLNSTDLRQASHDSSYGESAKDYIPPGAQDGSSQPKTRAGGAPGGNPRLYDIIFTVSASIKNTGTVPGDEVVQLYISLGGPNDAPKVLRGFEKLTIGRGATVQFTVNLERRDVMNWNPELQDWEITPWEKKVFVGPSSRKLPLSMTLIPATTA